MVRAVLTRRLPEGEPGDSPGRRPRARRRPRAAEAARRGVDDGPDVEEHEERRRGAEPPARAATSQPGWSRVSAGRGRSTGRSRTPGWRRSWPGRASPDASGVTEYLVNSAGSATSPLAGYTNRLSATSDWKRGEIRKSTSCSASSGCVGAAEHAGELDLAEARRLDDRRSGASVDRRVGEQHLGRRARAVADDERLRSAAGPA